MTSEPLAWQMSGLGSSSGTAQGRGRVDEFGHFGIDLSEGASTSLAVWFPWHGGEYLAGCEVHHCEEVGRVVALEVKAHRARAAGSRVQDSAGCVHRLALLCSQAEMREQQCHHRRSVESLAISVVVTVRRCAQSHATRSKERVRIRSGGRP